MIDLDTTVLDPEVRHDFVHFFDVTNGNPNGDPDAGNAPRIDWETRHGLVTDVCLKRKVRNYAQLRGQSIFIQTEFALNALIEGAYAKVGVEAASISLDADTISLFPTELSGDIELGADGQSIVYRGERRNKKAIRSALSEIFGEDAQEELEKVLDGIAADLADVVSRRKGASINREKRRQARDTLIRDYYDVRMFGAVMNTGLNAGQVRGPMQMTFARSIDPISILDLSITRQAKTTVERMKSGTTEMGRKHVVPYGLYRGYGFYTPAFGNTVTRDDLKLFWEALVNMLEIDRSAARGHMACRGGYVFSHDSPLGNAPSHKLFDRIKVSRRNDGEVPRSFNNYIIEVDREGLDRGVTLTEVWCG